MKSKTDQEEKFKILFDKAPLSYQSLDINGNILEVNHMWLETLGYDSKEEIIGKNFGDFLDHDWIDHFKLNFPKFKSIGEILGIEFRMNRKDNKKIIVSIHGRIGYDDNGDFKQTHCIFTDITKYYDTEKRNKFLEIELVQSKKKEALGRFANCIIHDLNNILTPMQGGAEILIENTKFDDTTNLWAKKILNGIEKIKDLLSQISSFSNPLQNEMMSYISINPIIDEVLNLMEIPKNIDIVKDVIKKDIKILGVSIRIHQILLNLLTNAKQALDHNVGTINIKLEEVNSIINSYSKETLVGNYAHILVSDNGHGMKQETIDKIFDPFFTTKHYGTGIGLSIVDSIVKGMNGYIFVDSEINVGTTFHIYLPIAEIIK